MKFIKNIFTYLFILIFANLSAQYFPKNAPKNLEQKAEKYADSLYQQLSLDEKIGQLYIVALYNNRGEEEIQKIRNLVEKEKIGGLILMQDNAEKHIQLLNEFQGKSRVKMMIGIDGEWGLFQRFPAAHKFPWAMTLGAIQDNSLIYEMTSKIAEDCNGKPILERFADNPFLPKFYKDQNRYAFPLEMSFLADRYQQLSDDLAQFDLFKDFVVADYHIFKSLIFAKVTLQEDEFRLYKTMFDIIHKEMPKPDLYVYLYQNTERLLENIKKRGRSYEQEIPADYLEKINQGYLDYIKTQTDLNVLIIDVSDLDFVKKQEDYVFLLNEINRKIVLARG